MIQIFLSIGAIVLLSIATLSMNRGFEANDEVMRSSKYAVIATSLAASTIEDASGLAFDEASIDSMLTNTSGLTSAGHLGLESGEVVRTADDFDDFNGYSQYDTVDVGGVFNKVVFLTSATITYVEATNPELTASSPTMFKKISVSVTCPVMKEMIRQEMVFSYFRFQ
jgi:hypothetical protein